MPFRDSQSVPRAEPKSGIAMLDSVHPSWRGMLKDLKAMGITEDQIEEQADFIKSYIEQRETEALSTKGALKGLSKASGNNSQGHPPTLPISSTRAEGIASKRNGGTVSQKRALNRASPIGSNMQEQLDEVARNRNAPSRPQSKYPHVDVLLLRWAADDLGVLEELEKLNNVFRSMFKFTTRTWDIPSEDSEDELMREIMSFRKGKLRGDLMILYYGGHAGGTPQECIWAANEQDDPPTLNWHNVQSYLLGSPADVLLILDCCFATLAARNSGIGDNWLLGASVKETAAAGVSRNSFTSALTRELDRTAHLYWTEDKCFTVQDIHHALILWERDLRFTPCLTRLTDHDCEPTGLTPLLHGQVAPKLQTVKSDPQSQMSYDDAGPSSAGRPIVSHATFPYSSDPIVPQERDFSTTATEEEVPIELSIGESQTVRISGLPPSANKHDVIQWLEAHLNSRPLVSRMGTMAVALTNTIIVTFSSVATARQALSLKNKFFATKAGEAPVPIALENEFLGLTCIYSSRVSSPARPYVDLVLVHGAHGHAINSFACHFTNSSREAREALWALDALPKALETVGIVPRIMTYGWNADSWLDSTHSMNTECETLIKALESERSNTPNRPIVFIGHGIGGLLIKQTVNEIVDAGMCRDIENPVKGCYFFAVPHHKPDSADGFASILADMEVALQQNGPQRPELVKSLKPRNRVILNLSSVFNDICSEHGIATVSFYEDSKTGDCSVVPKELAILDKRPGKSYGTNSDYRDILKLSKPGHSLKLVTDILCSTIATKLGLTRPTGIAPDTTPPQNPLNSAADPAQTPNKEKVYARLIKYDTVLVVDDSESMSKARWKTTAHVLAAIAAIAVHYDRDGVDIRFFNSDVEARNLESSDKIMELFGKVEPDGPTPTADVLETELNEYLYEYGQNRRQKKGLNLIILTDGEPERGQDVEGIIVKYAKKLERIQAPPLQVGVQFVQIGGDKKAAEFLKSLDDDLKDKHGLDRDMVDTVPWVEGDEDRLVEKILLGGILKRIDDDKD
ncbi:hypothetical protein MMC30_007865 [Trapelia coarctata]|nr:hypothetical protein [Trapelia coarctata]